MDKEEVVRKGRWGKSVTYDRKRSMRTRSIIICTGTRRGGGGWGVDVGWEKDRITTERSMYIDASALNPLINLKS